MNDWVSLALFLASLVVQGSGCFYQWWTLRRITKVRKEVDRLIRIRQRISVATSPNGVPPRRPTHS